MSEVAFHGRGGGRWGFRQKMECPNRTDRTEFTLTDLYFVPNFSLSVSLHEVSRTPPNDDGIGASFLLGHAGIYAVSALVFNSLGLYI